MSDTSKSIMASSNWLALQKKLPGNSHVRKKRKIDGIGRYKATLVDSTASGTAASTSETSFVRGQQKAQKPVASSSYVTLPGPDIKNGESLSSLRKMVLGEQSYTASQEQPGKYLSLDCEMVGVGIDGKESSLARVSLVNYYGAIQMDGFVRQRERVVDYRTEFSGVRPSDMVNAQPFSEVQQKVADFLKDRVLVGHAVHNDLKALLLSHPRHQTRDTQFCAAKHKLTKSNRPALRHLVLQELGLAIQQGEHSSVIDARATMALYRLHRKEWDKGFPHHHHVSKKRERSPSPSADEDDDHDQDDEEEEEEEKGAGEEVGEDDETEGGSQPADSSLSTSANERKSQTESKRKKKQTEGKTFPGGGRKGISSGLSTVVKANGQTRVNGHHRSSTTAAATAKSTTKTQWWKHLGSSSSLGSSGNSGSKGSLRLKVG